MCHYTAVPVRCAFLPEIELPHQATEEKTAVPAGFSYVFICDDGSDDNSTSMNELYKARDQEYVQIIPSPVLKGGIPGQHACYAACKEATLAFTDWWFVAVRRMCFDPDTI